MRLSWLSDRGAARRGMAAAFVAVALGLPGTVVADDSVLSKTEGAQVQNALLPGGWQPLDLVYEIHAGGLHAFTIDLKAALDEKAYDMAMALRTDGTLSWVLDWTMESVVRGRLKEAGTPMPERFRTESLFRGNERSVELRYESERGAPTVEALPPPEEDDRDLVPDALKEGTIDPLSAGVALIYALADTDRCEASFGVFDGRRRFNASSRDQGEQEISTGSLSPYGGLARACAVSVEPVTGFWRNHDHEPRTQDFTVFLRQVSPGTPPLPVRIEAETRFGGVRIHLIDMAVSAEKS